jgi:SAM-dependent methyltransferase
VKNLYDDADFWVTRVADAKNHNDPFRSVFRAGSHAWRSIIKGRLDIMSEKIQPSESVLDAGCSFGWLSQHITNDYVGVDQTPALVEYGRELYPDVTLILGKLQELPFDDNSFDWIVCSCVKYGIVECEEGGLMPPGRWEKIESEFLRVAKGAIIWPSYQPEYEIILR